MTLDARLGLLDFLDRSGRRASVAIYTLHKVDEAAGELAKF
jgi:hypothetical protein